VAAHPGKPPVPFVLSSSDKNPWILLGTGIVSYSAVSGASLYESSNSLSADFSFTGPVQLTYPPANSTVTVVTGGGNALADAAVTYVVNGNIPTQAISNSNAVLLDTQATTKGGSVIVFSSGNTMSSLGDPSRHIAVSSFGSVPATNQVTYAELQEALTELHSLDDGEDWKIQTPVYNSSIQVAAALFVNGIPAPEVFSHGSKSVVFNWPGKDVSLYLTVTKNRLAILISSIKGIEYRAEIVADNASEADRFFTALRTARLPSPQNEAVF
jgi:hypothetical protein